MNEYKVTGADKESGNDRCEIVFAKNPQKAADAARAKGMYVSSVENLAEGPDNFEPVETVKTVKTVSSMTPQELFWTIVGAIIFAPLIPGILVLLIYLVNKGPY